MKTILLAACASILLACTGSGGDGSIYPGGSRAGGAGDAPAHAARLADAARAATNDHEVNSVHISRHVDEYLTCAQCRTR